MHLLENPYAPDGLHGHAVAVTVVLLVILGGVFLLGFTEAVVVAIPLVARFLALNAVVVAVGLTQIVATPQLIGSWTQALTAHGTGFLDIAGPAIIAFPLLVLGLSGFETGVSMMPLVAATGTDPQQRLAKYLPACGMAPEWGRAVRPVVLVYTAVSILITLAFRADVNAQAGAYATGILAMMVSAAVAVTISAARGQQRGSTAAFSLLTLILLYALVANVFEAPDGLTISMMFIAFWPCRWHRGSPVRWNSGPMMSSSTRWLNYSSAIAPGDTIRLVANEPDERDPAKYAEKRRQVLRRACPARS